jgi:hypothetical protein
VLIRKRWILLCLLLAWVPGVLLPAAWAQEKKVPKVVPVPPMPKPQPREPVREPTNPPAQTVSDAATHIEFHLPAGWNLSRSDGELSTFHLDARSAPKKAQLRAVASLGFNPFPLSTFSGALFYLSVTPHSSVGACSAQTTAKPVKRLEPATVADIRFTRGRDEHGHSCTEARDVAYTALRGGSCLRFDLAVNTFCGGDMIGAEELTEAQLGSLFKRMEGILDTVQFVAK